MAANVSTQRTARVKAMAKAYQLARPHGDGVASSKALGNHGGIKRAQHRGE